MIKKSNLITFYYLFFATMSIIIFNNLLTFCIINLLLIVVLCINLKIDIKNPLLLFLVMFILYQISYPILNQLGIKVFEYCQISENYFLYSWIATVSFLVFYGSIENVEYKSENIMIDTNNTILKLIYFILIIISAFASMYIIRNGFQSKYDLANSENFILKIGNISYTILIIFPAFFLLSRNMKKSQKIILAIINMLVMIFGLFTYGERSFVFNYFIVLIVIYFTMKKIDMKKIIIILASVIFFVSISSSFKMFFSSEKYKAVTKEDSNIIIEFLNSDFASAGFNFNYLLNQNDKSIFLGKTYIFDFLSPIDDLVNVSKFNASEWYRDTYWSTRRTGLGFTIIGEGYINFGLLGIIFEMYILAKLIKFFYIKSNKNYYFYVIYIGFISLAMYSCRQTLASIISPLVKYHFFMAIIVYFINKITLVKDTKKLKNN